MTTQTEITKSHQVVQAPLKVEKSSWPFVLAALLIISLIGVTLMVIPTKGEDITGSRRALEAISARYQGQVDLYTARGQADSQRALEAISARYQGLADLHAANSPVDSHRVLEAISARYQGQADSFAAKRESDSQRALEAISARYQGLADLYLVQEK